MRVNRRPRLAGADVIQKNEGVRTVAALGERRAMFARAQASEALDGFGP